MDFLWLFLMYVMFLVICVSALCLCSGRSNTNLDRIFQRAEKVISLVLPTWLQRNYNNIVYERSAAFVVTHLVLDALVFAEYTWEVFGYCLELEINWLYLITPYILVTIKLCFFFMCCVTDPGKVTKENADSYTQVYKYDNVFFHQGKKCPTCHLMKPARSKHCGVCGSCVQRFDHHCVWVNNCIGAFNTRYFLLYLLSLNLTVICLAAVISAFLLQVVLLSHMMTASYIDPEGQQQIVGIIFIVQHLFLTFPRILFTLGFLLILLLLLGGYSCFVLYLCCINQTTNEWYKTRKHSSTAGLPFGSPKVYSRGFLGNVQEIFQPHNYYKKDR
ncbi:palmitoyltransferase ZDHHC4 [Bombina bombina]|uniref:palmitoyltransferase ZDHHC4 n=1 Tax=Bombina bombina TaxID=8345 RepID=UPI00235A7115|nr:palmitoyltransferase ZDHHC4 [Bombina bombina]XP_053550951.1 palmitoyltransferase ZDHHC4 [Bombina bombina]